MVKQQILEDLKRAAKDLDFETNGILLSIPQNPQFGDYSTNIALQLAKSNTKSNKQSPTEIANKILGELGKPDYLERLEIAGKGFINFFVKPAELAQDIAEILQKKDNFGKSNLGKGKKARVEFISANPTGPLHIGNARSGPLGDVMANVLQSQGYKVIREFIDNDVGEQVKALGATIKAKYHNNLIEKNQYQGEYIDELINGLDADIAGKTDQEVGSLAVAQLHAEIMADAHSMGIKFDLVVHESELRAQVPEIIEELKEAGVVKEKDGALWLAPSDEFLKDRETVIQKSNGDYTYFTADIVYHKMKFESRADLIIDVFGSNHHGHIARLQAAVLALGFDPKRLKVVLYQYVSIKRGLDIVKMSKRAGNFITAREVLDEVGKDAFRFYLLRFSPQTHMDFDLDLLKEHSSKNPVFYVQYAHARMANILVKNKGDMGNRQDSADMGLLIHPSELNLIKHLLYFPDLVREISQSLQVHHLTDYAITLADLFHKFYESCPVLSSEKNLREARLALVKASRTILASTLNLLGVSAPERM